jgi:hypothetical protein
MFMNNIYLDQQVDEIVICLVEKIVLNNETKVFILIAFVTNTS